MYFCSLLQNESLGTWIPWNTGLPETALKHSKQWEPAGVIKMSLFASLSPGFWFYFIFILWWATNQDPVAPSGLKWVSALKTVMETKPHTPMIPQGWVAFWPVGCRNTACPNSTPTYILVLAMDTCVCVLDVSTHTHTLERALQTDPLQSRGRQQPSGKPSLDLCCIYWSLCCVLLLVCPCGWNRVRTPVNTSNLVSKGVIPGPVFQLSAAN